MKNSQKIYREFICLARATNNFGHCFAGKEIDENNKPGSWIRPVCDTDCAELSEAESRYQDGSTPEVLDILGVNFKQQTIHPLQEENFAIDEDYYWTKKRKYHQDLSKMLDTPSTLWENGCSSENGKNDSVPIANIITPGQSLFFISPANVTIIVSNEGVEFNNEKKKVSVQFDYNEVTYLLLVTDSVVEADYLEKGAGTYSPSNPIYITVSLGDECNDHYYKLAVGLIEG